MTNEEIMCELLKFVINDQWSDKTNQSCSCHPEYVASCQECGALEYTQHNGSLSKTISGKHKPDCERMELITATRTALEKFNNSISEENEYDENGETRKLYIP